MTLPRSTPSLRRSAIILIFLYLLAYLVVLGVDLQHFATSGSRDSHYLLVAIGRAGMLVALLLVLTLVPMRRLALVTSMVVSFTALLACTAYLLHAREHDSVLTVVAMAFCFGSAVLFPWGARTQAAMVVGQAAVIATAQALGAPVLGAGTTALFALALLPISIVLSHFAADSRSRLVAASQRAADARGLARNFQRQMSASVRDRTGELEAVADELAELCRLAAHDLRPPLRTIAGFSEILLEGEHARKDAATALALEAAIAQACRMGQRIDRFRNEAREQSASLRAILEAAEDGRLPSNRADDVAGEAVRA